MDSVYYAIGLCKKPSVNGFCELNNFFRESNPQWLQDFAAQDGINILLTTLSELSLHVTSCFSDTILQLDCISCVRTLINNNEGIAHFLAKQVFANALIETVDTKSTLVRKHILEVLTALVAHSSNGHKRILTALQHNQLRNNFISPMSLLSRELRRADSSACRTAVLTLINSLISGCASLLDRIQLRLQLNAGYQFLEIMEVLKRETKDADLIVQLQLYMNSKHFDDYHVHNDMYFDVNDHDQVYLALKSLVQTSEDGFYFLQLLHETIAIQSEKIAKTRYDKWRVAVMALRHVNSAENTQSVEQCFNMRVAHMVATPSHTDVRPLGNDVILAGSPDVRSIDRKDSGISMRQSMSPHQAPISGGADRNKRQTFDRGSTVRSSDRGPLSESVVTRVFPDLPFRRYGSARSLRFNKELAVLQSPGNTHYETKKTLRHLPWRPVHPADVPDDICLWKVGERDIRSICPKAGDLEEIFQTDPRSPQSPVITGKERVRLELFLSRHPMSTSELCEVIRMRDPHRKLSGKLLQALREALPEPDALRLIPASAHLLLPATSDVDQLVMELASVPHLHQLLRLIGLRDDLPNTCDRLQNIYREIILVCREIINHKGLAYFLQAALATANFVNKGTIWGGLQTVRLADWSLLATMTSHSPPLTLLHVLVEAVQTRSPDVLTFLRDVSRVESAARYLLSHVATSELERLTADMKQFAGCFSNEIDSIQPHLESAEHRLQETAALQTQAERCGQQLRRYLCEQRPAGLSVQHCLKHVGEFIRATDICRQELPIFEEQRKIIQEKKLRFKAAQDVKLKTKLFGDRAVASSSLLAAGGDGIVESLLQRLHVGQLPRHDAAAGLSAALPPALLPSALGQTAEAAEDDPISISHIAAAASPLDLAVPMEQQGEYRRLRYGSSLQLNNVFNALTKRTFADRVENVIPSQYHRGKQMETASFLNNGIGKNPYDEAVPSSSHSRGLRRTNSDLNQSSSAATKWQTYELQHDTEVKNTDSSRQLAALDIQTEELMFVSEKIPSKKKKRSGFLKRLSSGFSKAIMRPRLGSGSNTQTGKCNGSTQTDTNA